MVRSIVFRGSTIRAGVPCKDGGMDRSQDLDSGGDFSGITQRRPTARPRTMLSGETMALVSLTAKVAIGGVGRESW